MQAPTREAPVAVPEVPEAPAIRIAAFDPSAAPAPEAVAVDIALELRSV